MREKMSLVGSVERRDGSMFSFTKVSAMSKSGTSLKPEPAFIDFPVAKAGKAVAKQKSG
jgi:hypothetical protein